jgi:hypothetical protein
MNKKWCPCFVVVVVVVVVVYCDNAACSTGKVRPKALTLKVKYPILAIGHV